MIWFPTLQDSLLPEGYWQLYGELQQQPGQQQQLNLGRCHREDVGAIQNTCCQRMHNRIKK